MQSLDYKLKTSNTSYVTARHDVQYFPSSLSSFSPTTSRVARACADTTQRHLGHALGGKAGNEAVAQVAHAANVDVAHRVVVGARKDGEEVEVLQDSLHGVVRVLQAASEISEPCPPAWPRRWGPRPARLASKWMLEPASLSKKVTKHHSPRVPCYMCYMCYISQGKPLNIHSPRVSCHMCYMCVQNI